MQGERKRKELVHFLFPNRSLSLLFSLSLHHFRDLSVPKDPSVPKKGLSVPKKGLSVPKKTLKKSLQETPKKPEIDGRSNPQQVQLRKSPVI